METPTSPITPLVEPPPASLPPPARWSQNPLVQRILPVVVSILLHGGLILLGVLTYRVIELAIAPIQEQIVIPEAEILTSAPFEGIGGPSPWLDPSHSAAAQDEFETDTADSWSNVPVETLVAELGGGESALIALGPQSGFGEGTGTPGTGSGQAALGRFGVPGGGGGRVGGSPIFPDGGAQKIIYVCDATGTMMDKIDALKIELVKAIEALRPVQAFNVIFFIQDSSATAVDDNRMLPASAANKQRAINFVLDDVFVPMASQTDPIPALRLAFAQQPEVIYFLTDGAFDNLVSNQEVEAEINRLNRGRRVRLNTIAFIDRDPEFEAWMKRIADENNGTYRLVTWADLRGR